MTFYYFTDLSHWKSELDIKIFLDAGHPLVVTKASDNYFMPDKAGVYDWINHTDAYFVDNFVNTRKLGLPAGAYHFCRWDRPTGTRQQIVQANLDYFQTAVALLPEEYQNINCVILDMEQPTTQLQDAGLGKAVVSSMAQDMVMLYLEHYPNIILYAGSWWTDQWLTRETTQWMAERIGVWEPEYIAIDSNNMPGNPDYQPSLPYGFSNEYAVSADDFIGKLFAWQYSSGAKFPGISSSIDVNQTKMPGGELEKLFFRTEAPELPPVDTEEVIQDLKQVRNLVSALVSDTRDVKALLNELIEKWRLE